jgi:hypothetical protein
MFIWYLNLFFCFVRHALVLTLFCSSLIIKICCYYRIISISNLVFWDHWSNLVDIIDFDSVHKLTQSRIDFSCQILLLHSQEFCIHFFGDLVLLRYFPAYSFSFYNSQLEIVILLFDVIKLYLNTIKTVPDLLFFYHGFF